MHNSLHDHILALEERIQELREQLTCRARTEAERARTKTDLSVAETALAHYRAAYELEERTESSRSQAAL